MGETRGRKQSIPNLADINAYLTKIVSDRLSSSMYGEILYRDSPEEPWHPITEGEEAKLRRLAGEYFRDVRGMSVGDPSKLNFRDQLSEVANSTVQTPILDRMERLTWDGVPRLSELPKRLGWRSPYLDPDTEAFYLDCVVRVIFLGAVERQYRPVRIPHVPILCGKPGSGKSETVLSLAMMGLPEDDPSDPLRYLGVIAPVNNIGDNTILRDRLLVPRRGCLLTELCECDGLISPKNEASLKALFDGAVARYADKYKQIATYPLTDIPIGTTNTAKILTDPTGNRRYMPVTVNRIVDLTDGGNGWLLSRHPDIVAQLWAEAMYRYNQGERWRPADMDRLNSAISKVTSDSVYIDPFVEDYCLLARDIIAEEYEGTLYDSDRPRTMDWITLDQRISLKTPGLTLGCRDLGFRRRIRAVCANFGLFPVTNRRHFYPKTSSKWTNPRSGLSIDPVDE